MGPVHQEEDLSWFIGSNIIPGIYSIVDTKKNIDHRWWSERWLPTMGGPH